MKKLTISLDESSSLKTTIDGFSFIELLGLAEFLRNHALENKSSELDQFKEYEESDLVSFGKYLLSEERAKRVTENTPQGVPIDLTIVYHGDVENWKEKQKTV